MDKVGNVGMGSVTANTAAVLGSVFTFKPAMIGPEAAPSSGPRAGAGFGVQDPAPQPPAKPIPITRYFIVVFWVVVVVTLGCIIAHVYLAGQWPLPTEIQKATFEKLSWGFTGGFGAILGLLGGKVI